MSHCGAFTGKERARYKLYSCCRTAALLLAKKGPGLAIYATLRCAMERARYKFYVHKAIAALRCFLLTKKGSVTGSAYRQ